MRGMIQLAGAFPHFIARRIGRATCAHVRDLLLAMSGLAVAESAASFQCRRTSDCPRFIDYRMEGA